RAAALSEAGQVESALAVVDRLEPELDRYHYLHATRAELLRRLDRADEARAAYERALQLVHADAERRFLEQRLVARDARRAAHAACGWYRRTHQCSSLSSVPSRRTTGQARSVSEDGSSGRCSRSSSIPPRSTPCASSDSGARARRHTRPGTPSSQR